MEKKEKVELILEQMRYCLANKDYIRTQIISKKISVRFFEKDEQQVQFYHTGANVSNGNSLFF